MSLRQLLLRAAVAALLTLADAGTAAALNGQVLDTATGNAIAGATVTIGTATATADASGHFAIQAEGAAVMARAPGYRATSLAPSTSAGAPLVLRLAPFRPKALYLSLYGIGNGSIRDAALSLIHAGFGLNALVIDIKSDNGLIAYKTGIAAAHQIGADRITTIADLSTLVSRLRGEGIYTIARIIVFRDDRFAAAQADLAVKTVSGGIFRDRKGLRWTDPFRRAVWDYNIAVAVEAARAGFDEIQFDYARFPDARGVAFSQTSTMASRIAAIDGFLSEARRRLGPYNVLVAADVFGYVCWNLDDTGIGQRIEDIAPLVDYLSPMLYPSGFQFGIPGYPDPVAHSYEIVRNSLDRALARTRLSPLRFRPWLQAFKDYAFDRRVFGEDEIKAQIRATEGFGSNGWMLWNPRNSYPAGILRAVLRPSIALSR